MYEGNHKRWCLVHGWVNTHLIHSECPRCGQVTVGKPSPEMEAEFKPSGNYLFS